MNHRNNANKHPIDNEPFVRLQFAISSLLYIMLVAAISLTMYNVSTEHKVLSGLNVLCAGVAFASASHIPGIWPLSNRLTLAELVTLFLCCLIVNGLRIPPVTTH